MLDPESRRWLAEPAKDSWKALAIALVLSAAAVILVLAGC